MAIFGIGKKSAKKEKKTEEKSAPVSVSTESKNSTSMRMPLHAADVLLRPRITEKAANLTSFNVYTFDVRVDAGKRDIANSVRELYKVNPVKVRVVNTPAKRVALRRRRGFGMTTASRKAYVYLKKGEQIQFN